MNYTYTSLERASQTGMKLGDYQGARVYATNIVRLNNESKFPDCIYCIYDYNNVLVRWNEIEDDWLIVGYLDVSGRIDDRNKGRTYKPFGYENAPAAANQKMKSKNEMKNESKKSNEKGNSNENEPIIADVRLEIEVENTLKNAREMSIDNLLAGFNYGLE